MYSAAGTACEYIIRGRVEIDKCGGENKEIADMGVTSREGHSHQIGKEKVRICSQGFN